MNIQVQMLVSIITLVALQSGCVKRQPITPDKGNVVVYSSVDEVFAEPICKQFEQDTGITVDLVPDTEETKSTGLLNRLISEKDRPRADVFWSGEVVIDVRSASKDGRLLVPPHQRGIAMLFQDLALWPNLTVAGNVGLGLSGLRLSRDQSRKRIDEALKLCQIPELAGRRPGTLSGGQQQRVALARALAMRPKLMLLDEPFGGLDLITKQSVLEQIAEFKSQLGFAVVLVTHDPAEVCCLCNSLGVLEGGRIAEQRSLEEITARPQTALGKAFVRALKRQQ